MIGTHYRLRQSIKAAGTKHPGMAIGPFDRSFKLNVDEGTIVRRTLGRSDGLMIDVGAHLGTSCEPFLRQGWTVHAFEPCSDTRRHLKERLNHARLLNKCTICAAAVGDTNKTDVPFYTSPESTGISTLSPFSETHTETERIDVVTLRDHLRDYDVDRVDFLKIDAEGNDLFVLKGFPFDRFFPPAVLCEFEDSKTSLMGYRWSDQANFLADLGYHVLVSEWHPVRRYGVIHQWSRLARYPCALSDTAAWGNLIAFRDEDLVGEAVAQFKKQIVSQLSLMASVGAVLNFGKLVGRRVRSGFRRAW